MDFWNRSSSDKHQQTVEPPAKRISTPAGQRLSVILENGDVATKTRDRISVRKSGMLAGLGEVPRESIEEQSGSGYSTSVWSDGEKLGKLKNHKQIAKRGGWKRLLIIIAILLVLIIALAVGLAVGLKKKSSSSSSSSPNEEGSPAAAAATSTTPTSPTPITPSSLPSNFPLGTWSIPTFLDTVLTNCTSNPSTWTCYPYTIYNDSPTKSAATFTWVISSPSSQSSKNKYEISSTPNPFSISFTNTALELLDEGKETERWTFQFQQSKTVSPSEALTKGGESVECEYSDTTLQGVLYTKMKRTFPDENTPASEKESRWPFAARVEQSASGGENVPSCKKTSNGERVGELEAMDAVNLCSCMYRNWRTPSPY